MPPAPRRSRNARAARATDSVRLRQGAYRGANRGTHLAFKGVPYALPPIGERRFAAPAPLPENDLTQDASRFGPACAQVMAGLRIGPGRRGSYYDEDCLYLNIFTPAADDARRPVMVWIHGGAFILGSSNAYDGGHLAEDGDIVVVTVNYRLGIFGFADVASVAGADPAQAPGNLGLRDMVAALAWVRDNIAAFGGDPDRVTIAGELAGSIAVSLLMLMDAARGLFHAAIMQSGAINLVNDRRMTDRISEAYRAHFGARATLDQLRSMSTRALLEAQLAVRRADAGIMAAFPWYDGDLLPDSLEDARCATPAATPLLAGFNREETALFEKLPGAPSAGANRTVLEAQVRAVVPADQAEAIMAHYPRTAAGARSLATDIYFAGSSRHFAERHCAVAPTWFYRFDYRQAWLGAAHAIELLFIWNATGALAALARGGPLRGARLALARRMRGHWISFIRDHDPGPGWPRLTADDHQTMIFDFESRVVRDPDRARRMAWDGVDITPRRN